MQMKFNSIRLAMLVTMALISAGCSDRSNQLQNEKEPAGSSVSAKVKHGGSGSTENQQLTTEFEDHQTVASWLESVKGKTLKVPIVIKAGGLGIESAILCLSLIHI